MKKILLLLIFLLGFFALPVFSQDFLPKYSDNIKNYGIGLYFGEGSLIVRTEPNETSKVVAKMLWNKDKVYINGVEYEPRNVFAVFSPQNAISAFIATDEQGTEYTKIIYNNSKGSEGWIKNDADSNVYYWRQLFYKYGKTKGLYVFSDITKEDRNLKLASDEGAEISYTFIYPKYIRLQLIKGNWALLKVTDYENTQKVGWFKWRNPDGTLNMFPKFVDN